MTTKDDAEKDDNKVDSAASSITSNDDDQSSPIDELNESSKETEKLLKTPKDVLCLATMAFMYFFATCNISVLSPFFPKEVKKYNYLFQLFDTLM